MLANRPQATAPVLDSTFEDRGVMHEAVDGGKGHGLIWKNLAPCAEGLIGGNEHRSSFVSRADQFEQYARLRLILGDVGEVVEDQQMIFVELGDRRFEHEIAARDLELLHEIGCSREQHAPFSIRASPSAAARWDFPPPGGPKHKSWRPFRALSLIHI